jgi:hypothetical protein
MCNSQQNQYMNQSRFYPVNYQYFNPRVQSIQYIPQPDPYYYSQGTPYSRAINRHSYAQFSIASPNLYFSAVAPKY